ncbi:MAG: UDP-N-acetylmuramate:L-alanyl-gamma-D-glutamyl-meso-diaminopimelate ligase, partial [Desulfatitalea sp.]|nr:UDP-N-acetylmuramate:L-alanyl-gamma-D-glutamyl-meso-diaminopimelate ligase [Desulfatitalea sp.]
ICIRQAPLLEKIPEQERFSSEQLAQDLRTRGKTADDYPTTDAIIDALTQQTHSGDVLLIMSNGGFDNIHARLLKEL